MLQTIQYLILFIWLYSGLAYADDAAVGLTVTPRDADVYVNGELKANKTPVVIRLLAGTYQFQIKKTGWQSQEFPIVIASNVIMPKVDIKLVAEPPPPAIDPQALISTVRDPFETEAEFATRRLGIIKQFNDAAATGDLRYKAGTARLNKNGYDINTQTFPLDITWTPWATKFGFPTSEQAIIPRDQSLTLWRQGAEHPIFLLFDPAIATPKVNQVVLWGLQRQWYATAVSGNIINNSYNTDSGIIHNNYSVYTNGTATDIKTGLMWKRCSEGQVWDGSTCTGESSAFAWDDVMPNGQQKSWDSFAGYNDWRVPTREELRSLVWCSNATPQEEAWDNSCSGKDHRNGDSYQNPTLDTTTFPNTPTVWFWSSSAYDSSFAWVVYFDLGYVNLSSG